MTNGKFEIPEDWGDPIAELREQCVDLPEDEEDRWAREGQTLHDLLPPEAHAELDQHFREMYQRMQTPEAREAIHNLFTNGFPLS